MKTLLRFLLFPFLLLLASLGFLFGIVVVFFLSGTRAAYEYVDALYDDE